MTHLTNFSHNTNFQKKKHSAYFGQNHFLWKSKTVTLNHLLLPIINYSLRKTLWKHLEKILKSWFGTQKWSIFLILGTIRIFLENPNIHSQPTATQHGKLAKINTGKFFWYLLLLPQNMMVKFNWQTQFPKMSKTNFYLSKGET